MQTTADERMKRSTRVLTALLFVAFDVLLFLFVFDHIDCGGERRESTETHSIATSDVRLASPRAPMSPGTTAANGASPSPPDAVAKEHAVTDDDELRISGTVLDAESKLAISGARVAAITLSPDSSRATSDLDPVVARTLTSAVTDERGRFALALGADVEPYLRVDARGFGTALAEIDEPRDARTAHYEITLRRAAAIDAHIVDEVGQPIDGMSVAAYTEAYRCRPENAPLGDVLLSLPNVEWTAKTDAGGTCAIEDVTAGVPLRIQLGAASRRRGEIELAPLSPGERRSCEWRIDLGCTLAATLVDENAKPVRRCDVWIFRAEDVRSATLAPAAVGSSQDASRGYSREALFATATTDDDGRFSVREIPAGSWCIGPAPGTRRGTENDDIVARGELVDVPRGARQREVVLHASHGAYIRGRVVDPRGAPPVRFTVTMRPKNAAENYFARNLNELSTGIYAHPGPDATFVLGPLGPGEFELTATGHDANNATSPAKIVARTGDRDVLIRLNALGFIAGRVIDASTGKVVRARVRISQVLQREASTSSDEGYRFVGLPSGAYTLIANTVDGRIGFLRDVAVESGSELQGLDIAVVRGARITTHYKGERGTCMVQILVGDLVIAHQSIPSNRGIQETVPAGEVVIQFESKDGGPLLERRVHVSAGKDAYVALTDDG